MGGVFGGITNESSVTMRLFVDVKFKQTSYTYY